MKTRKAVRGEKKKYLWKYPRVAVGDRFLKRGSEHNFMVRVVSIGVKTVSYTTDNGYTGSMAETAFRKIFIGPILND